MTAVDIQPSSLSKMYPMGGGHLAHNICKQAAMRMPGRLPQNPDMHSGQRMWHCLQLDTDTAYFTQPSIPLTKCTLAEQAAWFAATLQEVVAWQAWVWI